MTPVDTAPLPVVPGNPSEPRAPRLRGLAAAVEAVAGLVSGGLVVIGVGLVVLQLVAPELAPGTGLAAAAGPTWPRALATAAVGVAGEVVVWARRRLGRAARAWLAVAVIVAALLDLWWVWLR